MGLLGKPTILGNPPYINQKLIGLLLSWHVRKYCTKNQVTHMSFFGLPTLVKNHAQVYVLHPGNLT